jgi:hypothetical protein
MQNQYFLLWLPPCHSHGAAQAAEVNQMTELKSFESKPMSRGLGVLQLMRTMGMSVVTITAVLVLAGIALGLTGCTEEKSKNISANSGQSSHDPAVSIPPQARVAEPVVAKKKKSVVRRPSVITYTSSAYGVSFRFPGQYELTTPGNDDQKSALAETVPSNFVQPGGFTVATIELPSGSATSFFSVSANKSLSSRECAQFAIPEASGVASNYPVDESDGSIPSKTNIHGVEYSKVENASEQEDIKYYHHFEPGRDGTGGTCYEFAMGVEESRVSSKALDYPDLFDKLERVMATVTIKSQETSTVTATAPAHEPSGTSQE